MSHPPGLRVLFFTEMWERFSYYGMRAFLVIYMVAPAETGGLGFSDLRAGTVYGLYTAGVYLLGLPGGWLADRLLGLQRAVLIGGALIMAGHLVLAVQTLATFYGGLALVAAGTGLLKPNVSSLVGRLYPPGDSRKTSGFALFYMGINLGSFLAPLVCGAFLAESQVFRDWLRGVGLEPRHAWHAAFGSAALGMLLGLVQFSAGRRRFGDAGLLPDRPASPRILGRAAVAAVAATAAVVLLAGRRSLSPESLGGAVDVLLPAVAVVVLVGLLLWAPRDAGERRNLGTIALLFAASVVFWGCFEQAGSTLTLFALRHTDREVAGHTLGASAFAALNPLFVVGLAPVFARAWRGRTLSTIGMFGAGLLLLGAAFLVLAFAASGGSKASPLWLVGFYLLLTVAELCVSPVGLSAVTELAPARLAGVAMGVWFMGTAVGNYLAGRAVGLTRGMEPSTAFLWTAALPLALGAALSAASRLRRGYAP